MSEDVFTESLKSPACVEILFNCLRNVENQMKEIFFMTKSTNEQLIKVSKLEKQADQKEQYSKRNCLLLHGIKEVTGKGKDDIIIETISRNLDIDIAPHKKGRSHRIGQSKQPGEKPCPIIVKFIRYNDRNKIFRNEKKTKR